MPHSDTQERTDLAGIPRHLDESVDLFNAAQAMHEVLDPQFCRIYAAVKAAEHQGFLQVISPWEREHLLLNV